MFLFNFFKSKVRRVKINDWVTSNKNVYGKYLHCRVVKIYDRGRSWHNVEKFCAIEFEMDGVIKRVNVPLDTCRFI